MSDRFPARFGPFVLLRQLGAGGMGAAHLALHAPSGPDGPLLVVKRLHPELLRDPGILERFVHEAEVAAHVFHPHVGRLVAMGSVGSEPFLATEFVFGVPLSTVIARIEEGSTPQAPLPVALQLGLQIARGLRAIHEAVHRDTGTPLGLLHRDIGARNVMVGYDGRARVIDLGLGKSILSEWQTAHAVIAGSPDYMPPEQAMGGGVDARGDVYALGVTLWELVAGRRRIREATAAKRIERCLSARPEPLRVHRADASEHLEALLIQAMQPEPEHRLESAERLEAGLQTEIARLGGRRPDDSTVADWLDAACATLRAKATRSLASDRASARASLGSAGGRMEVLVGDVTDFSPPAPRFNAGRTRAWPALAARLRRSLSRSLEGTGIAGLVLALFGAAATAWLVSPSSAPQVVELRPAGGVVAPAGGVVAPAAGVEPAFVVPATVSAPVEGARGAGVADLEEALNPPPSVEAAPAAPSVDEGRRQALVARIRRLRRRRFDIGFQREVTRLSARISRARTSASLTALERAVARLEQRS